MALLQPNMAFLQAIDFYIFLVIGLLSLTFSWLAFRAAKGAREAAIEAGKTVKLQTVAVELTEISNKLNRLDDKITYFNARNLLNEISSKIRRLLSNVSYLQDDDFDEVSKSISETLIKAKKALDNVKPTTEGIDEEVELESVYFAVEGFFFEISNQLAELIGILERKSFDLGE